MLQVDSRQKLVAWLPIAAGLLLMCIPSFIGPFNGIWKTDRNAHGPIVLAVARWLATRISSAAPTKSWT
jgi:hypothetical protein